MNGIPDWPLIQKIQGGDPDALLELYGRYKSLPYAIALRTLAMLREDGRNQELAREIEQEFWALCCKSCLRNFDSRKGTRFRPYLSTMVTREALKMFKVRDDIKLMSVNHVREIPKDGRNQIIVARLGRSFYLRLFDHESKMTVDTDEEGLRARAQQAGDFELGRQIDDLRTTLDSFWPPQKLTTQAKRRIIGILTSIMGRPPFRSRIPVFFTEGFDHDPAGDESLPVNALITDEQIAGLRQCLSLLGEDDRALLVLFHCENRPYQEIAELMGMTVGAARTATCRARVRLRDLMIERGYQ